MDKLIAKREFYYRGHRYIPGEEVKCEDSKMVSAWLRAESVKIHEENQSENENPDAGEKQQENENNILELLSCESSEVFLRYFKNSLNELIRNQFVSQNRKNNTDIPQDFLVNHISGSFVEMVLWWIKGRMKQTPEELDRYFRAVIEPVL